MSNSLARAREIHEAATDGPWETKEPRPYRVEIYDKHGHYYVGTAGESENGRAIVFVHNTYAALLDYWEAAEAYIHELIVERNLGAGESYYEKKDTLEARIEETTDE